jgi:hypothetical protein
MKINPSPTGRRYDRPQVEAEIEALFGLLEQVFDKLKEKRAA